jgi:hypothetical protein
MMESNRSEPAAGTIFGMNIAIGCLLSMAAIILFGALILGLGASAGSFRLGLPFTGAESFIVLVLFGVLAGLPMFSLAMILLGIKSQILLLRKISKSSELTRLDVAVLNDSASQVTEPAAQQPPAPAVNEPASPVRQDAGPGPQAGDINRLVAVMMELRDTLLMTETERVAVSKSRLDQKRRGLIEKFHHHLRHDGWKSAEDVMKELMTMFPDDPQQGHLAEELAFARRRKTDRDLADAQDSIRAAAATGRWDMAEPIISDLELKYPDDAAVAAYVRQIRSEMEAWHREQRQNLIGQLREASDHRQWRRASLIAQQLLEKYPDDKMVEKLRAELPILRKNADLQEVKDLESQFKELLQRRRYEEAFPIAQKVIDEHPETAAANEMVKMLPKLQELIKQEKSRRNAELGGV